MRLGLGLDLDTTHPVTAGVGAPAPADVQLDHAMGVTCFTQATLDAFDAWNVTPATALVIFTDHSSWTDFGNVIDLYVTEFTADTRRRIWTIGLTITGVTLATVASGTHDSEYTDAATAILAASPADATPIIIRLGHECNSSAYPWDATGVETDYIAAYRRAHGLFRAVSSRFVFDWNNFIGLGSGANLDAYPGNAYVDVISFDAYWVQTQIDAHIGSFPGADDPALYWAEMLTRANGVNALAAFALARGRPMAVPEWGSDQDDPEWVELVGDWIAAHDVAYHCWFDNNNDADYPCLIHNDSQPALGLEFNTRYGVAPIFHDTFVGGTPLANYTDNAPAVSSVVSEVAQVTNVSTAFAGSVVRSGITGLSIGEEYRIVLDLDTDSLDGYIQVGQGESPFSEIIGATKNTAALTRQEIVFTPPHTSVYFYIWPLGNSAAQVVRFDNVKLYLN